MMRNVMQYSADQIWNRHIRSGFKPNTVEPRYNNIGLYDTPPIASDNLWHQLILNFWP